MAADVGLTERDAAVHTPDAVTPTAETDPGFSAILRHAHGDPDQIAAQLIHTGRTQDPKVWNEIQQVLGNGRATQIREAITRGGHHAGARGRGAVKEEVSEAGLPAQVVRNVLGVEITAPAGVRPSALEEVTHIVQVEVGNNEYAQQHFRESRVAIVIVPAHVSMTALPEFVHLQGKKTFDGRDWATVRGSGGTPSPDGRFSIAVAEESATFVAGVGVGYAATYSVGMHELAHVLESKGMTPAQHARVKQLYSAHSRRDPGDAGGTFTDKYGSENEQEYFAQSTNAFFGRNVMGKNHSGRAWLQQNDPEMYAFLVDLFDHHHNQTGAVAP
jgi:hypothetical protein